MELSRNKMQEVAMQILTSFLVQESYSVPLNIEETLEDFLECPFDEVPLFLKEVVIKALKNQTTIIENISKYLKKWKFSRLNTCDQAILILAYTSYYYLEEKIDKKVVINVAVELAKKYGEDEDYKFINAVLDNCLNDR